MPSTVFFDGRYIPRDQASFSPNDMGLIVGLGSFETLRLYEGVAFLAERHEARMREAARILQIPPPDYCLADIFAELSIRNRMSDARGRVLLTGGEDPAADPAPCFYAELGPLPRIPDAESGVSVIITSTNRFSPVSGIKSLSYLANHLARNDAIRAGANEALLTGAGGEILEGATSNFFLIVGGRLTTPDTDGRILPGITRGVVLEEASAMNVPVDIRPVRVDDLARASEAFITSSLREILPVRAIDGHRFEAQGAVTLRLADAYGRRVDAYVSKSRSSR